MRDSLRSPASRIGSRRAVLGMRALAVLIALALGGHASRTAHADPPVYFSGRWLLTQYWIAAEQPGAHDRHAVPIRTRAGDLLAMSCPRFVDDLSMEGTGRTWDGRLLNWDARLHGRPCFVEVDRESYPYGVGVSGYALVPFRSLAVDRRFIAIGHTVEIPEIAGLPLPDGTRHDGCFVAVDGGGAINGHHIDLFVPSEAAWRDAGHAGYFPHHVHQVVVDSARCAYARRYAILP